MHLKTFRQKNTLSQGKFGSPGLAMFPRRFSKMGQVKLDTDPTPMEANVGSGAGALHWLIGWTFLRTIYPPGTCLSSILRRNNPPTQGLFQSKQGVIWVPGRWWFRHLFLFSPRKLGKMNPFWRAYFSNGLKPSNRFIFLGWNIFTDFVQILNGYPPLQTDMAMENPSFEDASPIETSDFPLPVRFWECAVPIIHLRKLWGWKGPWFLFGGSVRPWYQVSCRWKRQEDFFCLGIATHGVLLVCFESLATDFSMSLLVRCLSESTSYEWFTTIKSFKLKSNIMNRGSDVCRPWILAVNVSVSRLLNSRLCIAVFGWEIPGTSSHRNTTPYSHSHKNPLRLWEWYGPSRWWDPNSTFPKQQERNWIIF